MSAPAIPSIPFPIGPVWDVGAGGSSGGGASLVYPPDVADSVQQVGRQLEVPLPEVFPIPDATIFNAECQQASNAAGSFVLSFTPDVTIPASNLAIMTSFTIYVQNMLQTTSITWTLLANGNPVPGYNLLAIFPGTSPRAANTFNAPMRFTGLTQLQVQITNGDGGMYLLGAAISGWFWPLASDRRWKSAGPIDVG